MNQQDTVSSIAAASHQQRSGGGAGYPDGGIDWANLGSRVDVAVAELNKKRKAENRLGRSGPSIPILSSTSNEPSAVPVDAVSTASLRVELPPIIRDTLFGLTAPTVAGEESAVPTVATADGLASIANSVNELVGSVNRLGLGGTWDGGATDGSAFARDGADAAGNAPPARRRMSLEDVDLSGLGTEGMNYETVLAHVLARHGQDRESITIAAALLSSLSTVQSLTAEVNATRAQVR